MIRDRVLKLIRKHKTRDPFELAETMGAILIQAPLKDGTRGFYSYYKRNGIICIDENLTENEARFVCAHELGHFVLHRKENAVFLKKTTFLNTNKYELQANTFAGYLLISDDDLDDMKVLEYSLAQAAAYLGIPEEILRLRIK